MKTIFEKSNGIDGINLTDESPDFAKYIPQKDLRTDNPNLPKLSELEVMRHYKELSDLNFCIEKGFYPLGSCTMKYNPKVNEFLASLEGFNIHPSCDDDLAQGALKLMYNLQKALLEVTGMDAITLQPSAGAHGEMTGMMIIKKYFDTIGENRTKVIIPDSAHGTNPASAKMAGFDIVEIKSSRNSFGPSEDWLNIVKTSQARHKIRQYFNRTKREEYTRKGEELFAKELASKDLSINSIDTQKLLKIYKKQNVDKLEELYYQIGRGRLVPKTILERYLSDGKEVNETDLIQQINDAAKVKEGQRKKAKNRFGIIVDGLDNVDLRIAKCCNPVPGDPIVGYITKGSGITIHHAECHNAKMNGRLVPVEWDDEHRNTFNAKIKVVALDRKNVLGDIIQRLATINTNITELNAQASADTVIINMSFSVRNIEQLLSIVNTIKRVKDVFSVERILQ